MVYYNCNIEIMGYNIVFQIFIVVFLGYNMVF